MKLLLMENNLIGINRQKLIYNTDSLHQAVSTESPLFKILTNYSHLLKRS